MTHRERVFLGVALLHRYKNSRDGSPFQRLFDLLDEGEIRQAEVLGKALRFGAMLTASKGQNMGELRFYPKKSLLKLTLAPGTRDLFGEVAEARYNSLAAALGGVEVLVKGR